jgi:hypothetical protein
MRFSVEYILMEHELLRSVCGTSKVMRLTIIKADMIRVVKGEISIRMRVRVASPISYHRDTSYRYLSTSANQKLSILSIFRVLLSSTS